MEKATKTPMITPSARRLTWLAEGLVALALAGLLAVRALDTGSWQQYFLAAVAVGVAINRFVKNIRG
ncbi:MAG TPA: hypothetical protein VJR27_04670 [Candidatus Saccharimonadales bacterium]|nr:hypothetical protein [Candidatus Saccharimonadales bacterium]